MPRREVRRRGHGAGRQRCGLVAGSSVSAAVLARGVTEKTEKRKSKHDHCGALVTLPPEIYAPAPWHRALRPEEWLVSSGLCLDPKHIEAARNKSWSYPDKLLESRDMWHNLTLDTLKEAFAAVGLSGVVNASTRFRTCSFCRMSSSITPLTSRLMRSSEG